MAGKGKKRFQGPMMGGGRTDGMLHQIEQLQAQMEQAQASLAEQVVVGSAGGGAVLVEVTGSLQVRSITIKPEVVDPDDVGMLQDLILSAIRDAHAKVEDLTERTMGPLTSGMNIPGLF